MDWTFVTTNPVASLIGAVLIGLVLGWFLTWLGVRRRDEEAGGRITRLESDLRASKRELDGAQEDAQHRIRALEESLAAAEETLAASDEQVTTLQDQLAALQNEVKRLNDDKAAAENELVGRKIGRAHV